MATELARTYQWAATGDDDVLILTRKTKETIHIGDDVVITVCHISDGRVKLGLQAPRDVSIRRGELQKIINLAPPDRDEEEEAGDEPATEKFDRVGPLSHRFRRPQLMIG